MRCQAMQIGSRRDNRTQVTRMTQPPEKPRTPTDSDHGSLADSQRKALRCAGKRATMVLGRKTRSMRRTTKNGKLVQEIGPRD